MRLFLLERVDSVGHDEASGFVVRARSAREARELVSDECVVGPGDEGREAWLDPRRTSCRALREGGKVQIILRDFLHG